MSQSLPTASFKTFATLLKSRSGLMIGPDKLYLLETRLASILKREKLRDLAALADRIRAPNAEALIRQVVEAMTTNESFFFRDDKPFQHFRNQALPRLMAARPASAPLRVWSAASSSGQEGYSDYWGYLVVIVEYYLSPSATNRTRTGRRGRKASRLFSITAAGRVGLSGRRRLTRDGRSSEPCPKQRTSPAKGSARPV